MARFIEKSHLVNVKALYEHNLFDHLQLLSIRTCSYQGIVPTYRVVYTIRDDGGFVYNYGVDLETLFFDTDDYYLPEFEDVVDKFFPVWNVPVQKMSWEK